MPANPSAPELPPSYDEAQGMNYSPPSYEELYGEFRRVDSPSGLARFVKKAIDVIANTVAAAVVLGLLNLIPIIMIIIGAVNKSNCQVNSNIPIWLVVTGSCTLLRSGINFAYRVKESNRDWPILVRLVESLLSVFIVIWFITGSIWVYWSYSNVDFSTPQSDDYCDKLTFMFAFIFITISYILAFVSCVCFCCCCCCICCRPSVQQVHRNTIHIVA